MGWTSLLRQLESHNDDIRRLVDKGYAVAVDSTNHMIVRDIPYLDANGTLQWGAFVTKLEFSGNKVRQSNHQVFFAGGSPHNIDGSPITNIGNTDAKLTLSDAALDIQVQRQFSNKLVVKGEQVDYPDFYAKIENYTRLIAGPARELYPAEANPFTYSTVETEDDSVFKIRDTMTTRAQITELSRLFKDEVVAVIGLGGTGAYILDFLTKMQVKEIRGFDGDLFHEHNQFRSPGAFRDSEFGKPKAEIYQARYENLRHGVNLASKYVDATSASDFTSVTFAFVAIDSGSARKEIFELLIALGIPYIDVGLGLDRANGNLSGQLRATYYSKEEAQARKDKEFAMLVDHPDAEYRLNIQIAELNALNAALAIIEYKKFKGFYFDSISNYHLVFRIADFKIIARSKDDDDANEN